MDMSINQRLKKFLFEKDITQEELRVKLGLKNRQQVSNWVNCNDPIPDKHLVGIVRSYPELNANWLIRGSEPMFNDQKVLKQINRNEAGFCEECIEKEREIAYLKKAIDKIDRELKELYRESGKLEERLAQYSKEKIKQN